MEKSNERKETEKILTSLLKTLAKVYALKAKAI